MDKLVSIITGTYNRPDDLRKAIESVQEQTYPNIEHVIVHDGPASKEVKDLIYKTKAKQTPLGKPIKLTEPSSIRFYETGRQWSKFLANSISAIPYQVAQWTAAGDYLCWLADDETITPDHIAKLVDLLEKENVDFVYSITECWYADHLPKRAPFVLGEDPPRNGRITQALYRVELLDYVGFVPHVGSGTDWYQIEAWMKAGAKWAFLPEVTHTHRIDKIGDGPYNERQRLKGQW